VAVLPGRPPGQAPQLRPRLGTAALRAARLRLSLPPRRARRRARLDRDRDDLRAQQGTVIRGRTGCYPVLIPDFIPCPTLGQLQRMTPKASRDRRGPSAAEKPLALAKYVRRSDTPEVSSELTASWSPACVTAVVLIWRMESSSALPSPACQVGGEIAGGAHGSGPRPGHGGPKVSWFRPHAARTSLRRRITRRSTARFPAKVCPALPARGADQVPGGLGRHPAGQAAPLRDLLRASCRWPTATVGWSGGCPGIRGMR
jgi:hypothetical protein